MRTPLTGILLLLGLTCLPGLRSEVGQAGAIKTAYPKAEISIRYRSITDVSSPATCPTVAGKLGPLLHHEIIETPGPKICWESIGQTAFGDVYRFVVTYPGQEAVTYFTSYTGAPVTVLKEGDLEIVIH